MQAERGPASRDASQDGGARGGCGRGQAEAEASRRRRARLLAPLRGRWGRGDGMGPGGGRMGCVGVSGGRVGPGGPGLWGPREGSCGAPGCEADGRGPVRPGAVGPYGAGGCGDCVVGMYGAGLGSVLQGRCIGLGATAGEG